MSDKDPKMEISLPPSSADTVNKAINATAYRNGNGAANGTTSTQGDAISCAECKFAVEAAKINVVATMRDNVRLLPAERHDEIFAEFEEAIKARDIASLADIITNWATGGKGYDYVGMPINDFPLRAAGRDKDDPIMKEIWDSIMEIHRCGD